MTSELVRLHQNLSTLPHFCTEHPGHDDWQLPDSRGLTNQTPIGLSRRPYWLHFTCSSSSTVLCHARFIPETTQGVQEWLPPVFHWLLHPTQGAGLQNQRSKWSGPVTSTRDSVIQLFLPTFPIDPYKDQEEDNFILVSSCVGVLEVRDIYQVGKQAWHRTPAVSVPMSKSRQWDRHPYETGGTTGQEWFSTKGSWLTRVQTVALQRQKLFLKLSSRVSVSTAGARHLHPFSLWCSCVFAGRLRNQLYWLRLGPG